MTPAPAFNLRGWPIDPQECATFAKFLGRLACLLANDQNSELTHLPWNPPCFFGKNWQVWAEGKNRISVDLIFYQKIETGWAIVAKFLDADYQAISGLFARQQTGEYSPT